MVCLVCLNYNDYETTQCFIQSILQFDSIDKIIVVDNCSTDNSFERLNALFGNDNKVDIIQTNYNGGYSYGNNRGIEHAIQHYSPEYLIISNPDVIFENSIVSSMLDVMAEDEKTAVVTCKMLDRNQNISKLCYWSLPQSWFKESLSYLFRSSKTNCSFSESGICDVEVVPGSFFAIRAKALKDVGFFDEGTFLYYEENILAYGLKKLGYKTKIIMDQTFIHNHSVTINKSLKKIRQFKTLMKSSEYYWKKCFRISTFSLFLVKIMHAIAIIERRLFYAFKNSKK